MNTPRDVADRMASRRKEPFVRQKFMLSRDEARLRAKREFKAYPSAAYVTQNRKLAETPRGRRRIYTETLGHR
jgi:hypothetical protein